MSFFAIFFLFHTRTLFFPNLSHNIHSQSVYHHLNHSLFFLFLKRRNKDEAEGEVVVAVDGIVYLPGPNDEASDTGGVANGYPPWNNCCWRRWLNKSEGGREAAECCAPGPNKDMGREGGGPKGWSPGAPEYRFGG